MYKTEQEHEFEVDYDHEEVSQILKSKEAILLNQRISKLEQELRTTLNALKDAITELGLEKHKNLGKVKGDDIKFVPVGKGIRVFGTDTKANKEILKAMGGVWNHTLQGWIYPGKARELLLKAGIVEDSVV